MKNISNVDDWPADQIIGNQILVKDLKSHVRIVINEVQNLVPNGRSTCLIFGCGAFVLVANIYEAIRILLYKKSAMLLIVSVLCVRFALNTFT